jgi:hypothetical protein
MKKLQYELKVMEIIKNLPEMAKKMKLKYESSYLDYYNDVCPRCKKIMRAENEFIHSIGFVGVGVFVESRLFCPYIICQSCASDIRNETIYIRNEGSQKIQKHIEDTILILEA